MLICYVVVLIIVAFSHCSHSLLNSLRISYIMHLVHMFVTMQGFVNLSLSVLYKCTAMELQQWGTTSRLIILLFLSLMSS